MFSLTRVFIIAASPIVRAGLESLLAGDARFRVVGSATELGAALEVAQEATEDELPNVLLVDAERHVENMLNALSSIIGEEGGGNNNPPAIVLLVPDAAQNDLIIDALRLGVHSVLPTTATEAEILAAIEATAAGLVVLQKESLDAMLALLVQPPHSSSLRLSPLDEDTSRSSDAEALTPREVEVLGMLAEGFGNKMIAFRLGISEHTVKFHVASVFG
ncbi:MAG: response regulator transcription factor, partial [Chloroflexia bacterium]